jgi:formylglycine-generating enzyme required for sulfatase activity
MARVGDSGRRRLDDADDFVRMEIVAALQRGSLVIPVLVGGAAMPVAEELPEALAPLTRRQALEISDLRFHDDVDRLIETVEQSEVGARSTPRSWSQKLLVASGLVTLPIMAYLLYTWLGSRQPEVPVFIDPTEYVGIPPGTFEMGCTPGDRDCFSNEKPRHSVTISREFWIGRTEATAEAYRRFADTTGIRMPPAPKSNPGWALRDHPIVNVTREEAEMFCRRVGGRLPTEAEWEYAARGGVSFRYPTGDELHPDSARYRTNEADAPESTTRVKNFLENGYGLFDMAGNVREWTADYYGPYSQSTVTDPTGPVSGVLGVVRGGSWNDRPRELRTSYRIGERPAPARDPVNGFRCVRDTPPDP